MTQGGRETEWIVRRWARHGQVRLYAATPGGTDLGYLDLVSGRFHSDDMSNLPLLRKAIGDHLEAQERRQCGQSPQVGPVPLPVPPPPSSPGPSAPPSMGSGRDLSGVRAGAAARERALAERQAQGTLRHIFARVGGAKTAERAWRIGADGEEAVARELARLGPRWRILHAVQVGERGADIDHVVIGPGGVFTVNSKHHPTASIWVGGDTFMVNGTRVPYVRKARHEARRASRLLTEHVGFPVHASGLIAVVGARGGFTVKSQPADGAVAVVPRRGITRFLESQPQRLDIREIDAVHEVARRSGTWRR